MEFESDFDKVFAIVGSNNFAKELLNLGFSVSEIEDMWEEIVNE